MITLFTGALGLCIAGLILWLVRRDHLHVDHGAGWLLVAGAFALLGFAPGIIDRVAGWLGIGYPPVLGLSLAIAVLVIKLLMMDIERSRIEVRNRRLTQRLGMLELVVQQLQQQSTAASGCSDALPYPSEPRSSDTPTGVSNSETPAKGDTRPA